MKKTILYRWQIVGVISLIVHISCMTTACGKQEVAEEKEVVRPVKTMIVKSIAATFHHTYPGKADAGETTSLSFQHSGKLIEFPAEKGLEVEKGQLLGRIDPRDFENQVKAEEAKFIKAQAELDRYRELYESDAVSLSDLEIQERNFDVAKSDLEIAKKALADTTLYAPFTGVVAKTFVDNYENVNAYFSVLELHDLSSIDIDINVPERDVIGAPEDESSVTVTAQFDALPGRIFKVDVKNWETEADEATQTFLVTLTMPMPDDARIRPGMTAQVTISFEDTRFAKEKHFTIPSSAVVAQEDGTPMVWVVDQETMRVSAREIEVKDMLAKDIRVLSGLEDGMTIVTSGAHFLRENMRVRSIKDIYKGE